MKKVILLLIDSLVQHQLEEALTERSVPALQFLAERASWQGTTVTVYPTMTATVDSSLLTGEYPDQHRVPGLIWYHSQTRRLVNYLNGLLCVTATGIRHSVRQNIRELNTHHLSAEVETIYEALAKRGQSSASFNAIVRRGPKQHRLRLPFLYRWLTGQLLDSPYISVNGPDQLIVGNLSEIGGLARLPRALSWPWRAYGVNDQYTAHMFHQLVRAGQQQQFSLLYLPDHDHAMHRKNPAHLRDAMLQLDAHLQLLLDAYGDWPRALEDNIWIITSDHGQTQIANQAIGQIDLDTLLQSFSLLPVHAVATTSHQLAVANNERMAYIYPLQAEVQPSVLEILCREARFDVIAWQQQGWVHVVQGGSRLKFCFCRASTTQRNATEPFANQEAFDVTDCYQVDWRIVGDRSVLNLQMDQRGQRYHLSYGDYPDALARLYGAIHAQDGPVIVVNARPRYELHTRYYPRHKNGGAHGGLHRTEAEIPLWIIDQTPAAERTYCIPPTPRLVDLKTLILDMLQPHHRLEGAPSDCSNCTAEWREVHAE